MQKSNRPFVTALWTPPIRKWREIMKKAANRVVTTREACQFLKISRPTFLKLIYTHQIRARKVGKGWKLLSSELEAYMRREDS
jgi:excisionase family DNA binding protein